MPIKATFAGGHLLMALLFICVANNSACDFQSTSHECNSSSDCNSDRLCIENACRAPCNIDEDCTFSYEMCENGVCVPGNRDKCGNFIVDSGEDCDTAGTESMYCYYGETSCQRCSEQCQFIGGITSFCGDGQTDSRFELCDSGAQNSDEFAIEKHCNSSCSGFAPYCGDGVTFRDECGQPFPDGPVISGLEDDPKPTQQKTWSWSSNKMGAEYRHKLDTQAYTSFDSSTEFSLSEGDRIYTFCVQGRIKQDDTYILGPASCASAILDNTAPTAPDLNYQPYTEDPQPTIGISYNDEYHQYRCRLDNGDWQVGSDPQCTPAKPLAYNTHSNITVQASDLAGNWTKERVANIYAVSPEYWLAQSPQFQTQGCSYELQGDTLTVTGDSTNTFSILCHQGEHICKLQYSNSFVQGQINIPASGHIWHDTLQLKITENNTNLSLSDFSVTYHRQDPPQWVFVTEFKNEPDVDGPGSIKRKYFGNYFNCTVDEGSTGSFIWGPFDNYQLRFRAEAVNGTDEGDLTLNGHAITPNNNIVYTIAGQSINWDCNSSAPGSCDFRLYDVRLYMLQ